MRIHIISIHLFHIAVAILISIRLHSFTAEGKPVTFGGERMQANGHNMANILWGEASVPLLAVGAAASGNGTESSPDIQDGLQRV